MSKTEAIKIARKNVDMYRQGRDYRVSCYHADQRAWRDDPTSYCYSAARSRVAHLVAYGAAVLLGYGDDIDIYHATEHNGSVAARLARVSHV